MSVKTKKFNGKIYKRTRVYTGKKKADKDAVKTRKQTYRGDKYLVRVVKEDNTWGFYTRFISGNPRKVK